MRIHAHRAVISGWISWTGTLRHPVGCRTAAIRTNITSQPPNSRAARNERFDGAPGAGSTRSLANLGWSGCSDEPPARTARRGVPHAASPETRLAQNPRGTLPPTQARSRLRKNRLKQGAWRRSEPRCPLSPAAHGASFFAETRLCSQLAWTPYRIRARRTSSRHWVDVTRTLLKLFAPLPDTRPNAGSRRRPVQSGSRPDWRPPRSTWSSSPDPLRTRGGASRVPRSSWCARGSPPGVSWP